MAQPNNRQQFIELEYCFDKYFSQYLSPIVNKEFDSLNRKQMAEYRQEQDKHPAMIGSTNGGMMNATMSAQEVSYTGKWNTKHSEYLLEQCNNKFLSNPKIREDIGKMVVACRAALVSELGQSRYKEMSKGTPTGDLASYYVCNRFNTLFMEQLARKQMPKSSLQYIAQQGFLESLPGVLSGATVKSSTLDNDIKNLSEKFYNPSGVEKASAFGMSFLLDAATTGGYGSVAKAATWLAVDGGVRITTSFIPAGKTFDQIFSKEVFGRENAVDEIRRAGKKVNPQRSDDINILNGMLNQKLYKPRFDEKAASALKETMKRNIGQDNGKGLVRSVRSNLESSGIVIKKNGSYPKWMDDKTDKELYGYACYFTSYALEMKSKGVKRLTIGNKTYTAEQLGQKGYDYARALEASQRRSQAERRSVDNVEEQRREPSAIPQIGQSQYVAQSVQSTNLQGQSVQVQHQNMTAVQTPQQVSGWGGLLDQMGLGGFGDVGKNLGYVLAMLPDMLIGMFTGKTRTKIGDNLMPVAAIVAGMFTKNPLLKMLFIGFGGANLLNKVGHEALEIRDGSHSAAVRQYRQYSDEQLDPRISQPAMKGNTLVATIDNVPSVITVNDEVVDAYYQGAIPLNTLANAVLRKYDEQRNTLEESFEHQVSEHETKDVARGIK